MMMKNGSCLEKNGRKEQSEFRWISSNNNMYQNRMERTLCVL